MTKKPDFPWADTYKRKLRGQRAAYAQAMKDVAQMREALAHERERNAALQLQVTALTARVEELNAETMDLREWLDQNESD